MKRFILVLAIVALVAVSVSSQSTSVGTLADVEGSTNTGLMFVNIAGMIDNMNKGSQLYTSIEAMTKANHSVLTMVNKNGNPIVILSFPKKNMSDPSSRNIYYMLFSYAFVQGVKIMSDGSSLLIITAMQEDGHTIYDYLFPKDLITKYLTGNTDLAEFGARVSVHTGSAMND